MIPVNQQVRLRLPKSEIPTDIITWLYDNVTGSFNKMNDLVQTSKIGFGQKPYDSKDPIERFHFQVYVSVNYEFVHIYWNNGLRICESILPTSETEPKVGTIMRDFDDSRDDKDEYVPGWFNWFGVG